MVSPEVQEIPLFLTLGNFIFIFCAIRILIVCGKYQFEWNRCFVADQAQLPPLSVMVQLRLGIMRTGPFYHTIKAQAWIIIYHLLETPIRLEQPCKQLSQIPGGNVRGAANHYFHGPLIIYLVAA